jgi:transcriptional antiterminator NusG
VRNARGVTGFIGPGSRPIPLTDEEMEYAGMNRSPVSIDIAVGEHVRVLSGPLENFTGLVEDVDTLRQKIRVVVSMFGRETPVELEYDQVLRI